MKKIIFNNLGLKIASLFLAAILWLLVVQIEDPKDTRTFSNIQVDITGQELLEDESKVFEVLDNSDVISVTVRAPKSIISQLRASDIQAEADISKLTDINTIAITYSIQNVDVDYTITGSHDFVKLNIEDESSKWIKVDYDTVGKVEDGYIISSVTPDQTHIEVSGPKSTIDSVSYAYVEVDVSDATSNLTANPDIVLCDQDGNKIDKKNITCNVDYVHMSVEILATKSVPIEVEYSGEPEDGYAATGVTTCDPSSVKIAGTNSMLSAINKIVIPGDRVDISGQNGDYSSDVNIREYLPDAVKLADSDFNGRVIATVYIEKLVDKKLSVPLDNISLTNIPDGYTASITDQDNISVEIEGLSSEVSGLNAQSLKGTIDVEAWLDSQSNGSIEGNKNIKIDWDLSEGCSLISDNEVEVVIEKK